MRPVTPGMGPAGFRATPPGLGVQRALAPLGQVPKV